MNSQSVSAEQRETYERDGFLLVRSLISAEEAEELRTDYLRAVRGEYVVPTWAEIAVAAPGKLVDAAPLIDEEVAKQRGADRFMQLAHPSDCAALKHWATHPQRTRSLAIASALCPTEGLDCGYDQIFYKPVGSKALAYPHQDATYWGLEKPAITCWLALSPVTPESGAVGYYPGSHRQYLPHVPVESPWNNVRDFTVEPSTLNKLGITPVQFTLNPGDCVFHSYLTIHGSGPNLGAHARCGLATHFLAPSEHLRTMRNTMSDTMARMGVT
jgi:ectoine hydroxylase-related dioxygenase (phytanoyl-CoA dioxygenase family)